MDNNKKTAKKPTNEEKIAICEKYDDYLRVMHLFGNNIMLLKQLNQFGEVLKLYSSSAMFQRQMKELVEHEIIKYEPFFVNGRVTQHKIVILKKFAIRYLKGATDPGGSQKVAPVPRLKSNDRILLTTFKGSFILQKVIPYLKKNHETVSLDLILKYLSDRHMSLLTDKNKGIEYAKHYFNEFGSFLDESNMTDQINRLQELFDRQNQGLDYGSKAGQGKGKPSVKDSGISEEKRIEKAIGQVKAKSELFSVKDKMLTEFTFENMIRSNIHIVNVHVLKKDLVEIRVQAVLFDYLNKQNIYTFGKQIACLFKLLNDGVDNNHCRIHLTVGIMGYDQLAVENMKEDAKEVVYSPFIGRQDKRLALTLRNWQVDENQQTNQLIIKFDHYDITNQYFEGKKFANLLQGKPPEQPKNT
jgi:hypothetical protein